MKKIVFILLSSLILLSACGQKGALYIPQETEKSEEESNTES
ncbi:MAG: lipopeptide [Gammaproteobacteria bacterium]|nr:lipopeptide [Gammaproteobacteria bacterium]NKB63636.1 lipopeptide [Gammaproteobacteria bacterium]NKB65310.1 lipopeptide [Gammaproteobacteria bacterium]